MISVIVPVFNEEKSIARVLKELSGCLEEFKGYEIIVVDDGSADNTRSILKNLSLQHAKFIYHQENQGYGKSLFDGIVLAKHDCIAIIDGDGSYPAAKIKELYSYCPEYDMVVGARRGEEYQRGVIKRPARFFFSCLAEYAAGRKIPDVNSGLRIFKKEIVMKFSDSLCTGFSFTTTLTLIFLLNHYYVKFVPIDYFKREGESKIRYFKDTLRSGQIIVEAILYYNPIKLFLLLAICNLIMGTFLAAINYLFLRSVFVYIIAACCIASFLPIFCLGLISDQLKKIYNINKFGKS